MESPSGRSRNGSCPAKSRAASEGFSITGAAAPGATQITIAEAGDVNGDSQNDLVTGAGDDGFYLLLGRDDGNFGTQVDLRLLGSDTGNRFFPVDPDGAGLVAAGAGDVNSDGFADIIVGQPEATLRQADVADACAAYVVFGNDQIASPQTGINLDGVNGVVLFGEAGDDGRVGMSVAGAGDVNGDGVLDLVIGAPGANAGPQPDDNDRGAAFVIFGGTGVGDLNLGNIDGPMAPVSMAPCREVRPAPWLASAPTSTATALPRCWSTMPWG